MVEPSDKKVKKTEAENPLFLRQINLAARGDEPSSRAGPHFWLTVFSVLFTIFWLLAYDYLPVKTLNVVPGNLGPFKLYSDSDYGGLNKAYWIESDAPAAWACEIKDTLSNSYCGFHVKFSEFDAGGIDLSSYESVRLKLKYKGAGERFRVYLKNYNPAYTQPGDYSTLKMNLVSLRIRELEDELLINFREFLVPMWWVRNYDISREHAKPDFTNVTYLGIQTADPPSVGRHEVELHHIELIGRWVSREQWYLLILSVWLVVVSMLGVRHFVHLRRRAVKDSEIIGEMSRVNKYLRAETNKYKELSTVDRLTGTLNRLGFEKVYNQLIEAQQGNESNALIITDVDSFKAINDTYGHSVGDQILQKVAKIIMSNTRQLDTVCRWGGEEFVILCPSTSDLNAYKLAEKIRLIIEAALFSEKHNIHVTASFGVGVINAHEDFNEAFRRVDDALYDAKESGRNCTIVVVEDDAITNY